MSQTTSVSALAGMTDEGLFEQLATAILREEDKRYARVVHSGMNAAGKTVKSVLDGICFVPGADPPHLLAFHHTTTAPNGLARKWLHDPAAISVRKAARATPAGDLVKTAEIVEAERNRTPTLRATLVLTCNSEPDVTLVGNVEAAARQHGIEVDLWSRSRLAHVLDHKPEGQWLRREFLGIEQEQLSRELFRELSRKSLAADAPLDDPTAWVPRVLDDALEEYSERNVTFLIGGSGTGKSVACFRRLRRHIDQGGMGLVLPHDIVATSATLEQALIAALTRLHPILATGGPSPLSLCSASEPLFLSVEDINRSGQTQMLAERIASWAKVGSSTADSASESWRLTCPLWPELLAAFAEQTRKRIEANAISGGIFSESEGQQAILARSRNAGKTLSASEAQMLAEQLGLDPLLIALHDTSDSNPDAAQTVGRFVENALTRVATTAGVSPASEYRRVIRLLGAGMLLHRQFNITWPVLRDWKDWTEDDLGLLGRLAHHAEILRYGGPASDQMIVFRHDRVRQWILADAALDLVARGTLPDDLLADPFFAEVFGEALVAGGLQAGFLARAEEANPLVLFHALRMLGSAQPEKAVQIIAAIDRWLDRSETHSASNQDLRWEALAMLSETSAPQVIRLVGRFREATWQSHFALTRNGDLYGAIRLCARLEPGTGSRWRDSQVEHAKLHHGGRLIEELDAFLRRADNEQKDLVGALRLAGHLGDNRLVDAIEQVWINDPDRLDKLEDYIWAASQCGYDDPKRLLGPMCYAWASLPEKGAQEHRSPRFDVGGHQLRWALHRNLPEAVLDYLLERARRNDELSWPLIYVLHGVDHPRAVLFIADALADMQTQADESGGFVSFTSTSRDDWRRLQETGRPMSPASRDALLALWLDLSRPKNQRLHALGLWAATKHGGDLEQLWKISSSDKLADRVLAYRVNRGDITAIPAFREKLTADENGYWWQYGRDLWSDELTDALDAFLTQRESRCKREYGASIGPDWFVYELVMRLPTSEAERLLVKHWEQLKYGSHYVQAALYIGTPWLLSAAEAAIAACPEPKELLKFVSSHFGIRTGGHRGMTSEAQIVAIAPYLQHLDELEIATFWRECNDRGWYAARRQYLDPFRDKMHHSERLWDETQAEEEFDKMAADNHPWLDRRLEEYEQQDVAWPRIFASLLSWLEKRRSIEALKLTSEAIKLRGSRADARTVTTLFTGDEREEAKSILSCTDFAVRRRRIE